MSVDHVTFHELAEQELFDAASYYEAHRPGLGRAFIDEVEDAVAQICDHPEAAPVVRGTVRRKLVRRFPYSLMYSEVSGGIRILAVANQKRRPMYWYGRR